MYENLGGPITAGVPEPITLLLTAQVVWASSAVAAGKLAATSFMPTEVEGRNINWSGYSWQVRTSQGNPQGPGPNKFSDNAQNACVDAEGNLHLKIIQGAANSKWTASEVDLNQSLGCGTYE